MRAPCFRILCILLIASVVLGTSCDDDSLREGYCGNGILNKGEECDEGISNSDLAADACRRDCTLPSCGDGIKDSEEECDGYQLDLQTCSLRGYDRGTLSCANDCTFDTSLCSKCGNSLVEGVEECDGPNLGGVTCTWLGFTGGTLACYGDCTFDRSQCVGGCGNGVEEEGEACDGDDVGTDCASEGFEGGTIGCLDDCVLDLSGCVGGCGNGVIDAGETCDDGNRDPGDGCAQCRMPSGSYSVLLEISVPYTPSALDVGDYDGDGLGDLILGTVSEDLSGGGMTLYLSSQDHAPLNVATGAMVTVRSAQVDPGALPRLLGVSVSSDGTATWHYFQDWQSTKAIVTYTDRPRGMVVADVDGLPGEELFFVGWPSQSLVRFSFDGGLFTPLLGIGGNPGDLAVVDFNGDGVKDFLAVRAASQLIAMILGLGEQTYAYSSARYVGGRPSDLAVADLNGDGYSDILVTDPTNPLIYLFKGGSGGLSYSYYLDLPANPHRIAVANLNHDAVPDLLISFPEAGQVVLYEASGDFSYSVGFTYSGCHIPIALRVADMDGDGLNDLVIACTGEKKVVVLRADPM